LEKRSQRLATHLATAQFGGVAKRKPRGNELETKQEKGSFFSAKQLEMWSCFAAKKNCPAIFLPPHSCFCNWFVELGESFALGV